jgi:hypothetical protein
VNIARVGGLLEQAERQVWDFSVNRSSGAPSVIRAWSTFSQAAAHALRSVPLGGDGGPDARVLLSKIESGGGARWQDHELAGADPQLMRTAELLSAAGDLLVGEEPAGGDLRTDARIVQSRIAAMVLTA